MSANFPLNPNAGDVYTFGGTIWRFDGTTWKITTSSAAFPSFTGNVGKYVTTNGNVLLFDTPVPSPTSNVGKYLSSDGNTLVYATVATSGYFNSNTSTFPTGDYGSNIQVLPTDQFLIPTDNFYDCSDPRGFSVTVDLN